MNAVPLRNMDSLSRGPFDSGTSDIAHDQERLSVIGQKRRHANLDADSETVWMAIFHLRVEDLVER